MNKSYSRRGVLPPGVTLADVTGIGVIAAPVLPRLGTRSQLNGVGATSREKCSASIAMRPPDSMNPDTASRVGDAGFSTGACTTMRESLGPVIVIATWCVPTGAFFQSTETASRRSVVIVPLAGETLTHGCAALAVNANGVFPRS